MSLKKNTNDTVIAGVCSGIADELKIDPVLIRVAFAVGALMGFGLPIILYIVLAIVLPSE